MVSFCSDSLVEEAYGGKPAAVSYIERDEEGYLASEVTLRLSIRLLFIIDHVLLVCTISLWLMEVLLKLIVDGSIEAVVIDGSAGCLRWEWSC